MAEVRNNGVPLIDQASGARITQAIVGLAAALSGETAAPAAEKAAATGLARWFSFWPGKGSEKTPAPAPVATPTE
jgi:pilus assembly protein CpaE